MKKLFSLLLMTLMAVGAWATDVTFSDFAFSNWTEVTKEKDYTMTADGVTLEITNGTNTNNPISATPLNNPLRIYKGYDLTVSASSNITAVEFTIAGDYSATNLSVNGTALTSNVWTGDATSVKFVAGAQVRVSEIKVTIDNNPDALNAPTILLNGEAPKAQYLTTELPLTLTVTSNNGAATPNFCYSLSGKVVTSDFSTSARSLVLGDDNVLNLKVGSNTLYVQEMINDVNSAWATATFIIAEPAQALTSLAQVNALPKGAEFEFAGNTVVLGGGGTKNLYIVDADNAAGTLIYDASAPFSEDFTFGKAIAPNWSGKKDIFSGKPEVINATLTMTGETVDLTPVEVSIADVKLENFGRYAVLKGVTFDGENYTDATGASVAHYDQFKIDLPTDFDGKTYDVTGVIGYHNKNQFMPLEFNEAQEQQNIEISFLPEAGEIESGTVVVITATGMAKDDVLKYTINDGNEQEYPANGVTITGEAGDQITLGAFVYGADGAMKESNRALYTILAGPQPFEPQTFALVTSDEELEAGKKYIIVANYEGDFYALSTTQNTNNRKAVAVKPNEDETITSTEEVEVITLGEGSQESTWTLGVAEGFLYAASSSSNQLRTEAQADANADAAIAIGDETTIVFQGENSRNTMRFNPNTSNNNPLFSCYAGTSTTGINPLIYKLVEEQPVEAEYYVVGDFNGWDKESTKVKLEPNDDGDLETSVDLAANDEFKIITPADDTPDGWRYLGGIDENQMGYYLLNDETLGFPTELVDGSNFRVEKGGNYTLLLRKMVPNGAAGIALADGEVLTLTVVQNSITAVEDINVNNIASVKYVNLAGQVSATPFDGVNIQVTTMKDGSKKAVKVVK